MLHLHHKTLAAIGLFLIVITTVAIAEPQESSSFLPVSLDDSGQAGVPLASALVQFSNYDSLAALYQIAPEARAIVGKYGPESDAAIVRSSGEVARVTDRLILFRSLAAGNCGSLGCDHRAFSILPSGPFLSLDVVIPGPIAIAGATGDESLFLCTHQSEWVEWKRQGSPEFAPVPLPLGATRQRCGSTDVQ